MAYSAKLILGTILGMECQITDDPERFSEYQGGRIHYGPDQVSEGVVSIPASGLLAESGVRPLVPDVVTQDGLTWLFPSSSSGYDLGFDLFSAAFYMTTRYEEYLPFTKDRNGRFEASESLAYKKGFLSVPVVDHYALLLKQVLKRAFPFLNFPPRSFRFIPTIDVDVAYAFRGRGMLRTLYGILSSVIAGDLPSVKQRIRVLNGKEADPFDSYDLQIRLHKEFDLQARYFFLCGDRGPFDRSISFTSGAFRDLVKKIDKQAVVGIHPSVASNYKTKKLTDEINRLSAILHHKVSHSRQHYLMLSFPATYRELIKNNIAHDYSMGFASRPGFRAGTCTPYFFYDLEAESVSNLKIYPLCIMDGTLRDYMKLTPDEAIHVVKEHIQAVKKVQGTFVSLWHNDALSNTERWDGWLRVYKTLLTVATS